VYERLVRRALRMKRQPAVVMVQVLSHGQALERGAVGIPGGGDEYRPFYATLEDVYSGIAAYYDLQALSFRDATYRLAKFKKAPGFTYAELMEVRSMCVCVLVCVRVRVTHTHCVCVFECVCV
jgi:hypothetical protein